MLNLQGSPEIDPDSSSWLPSARTSAREGVVDADLFSLENLTRLSEEEAFRRRIDQRNLARIPVLLLGFAIVAAVEIAVSIAEAAWSGLAVAALNLSACVVVAFSIPVADPVAARVAGFVRHRIRRPVARRATAFAALCLALQLLLVVGWVRVVYQADADDVWPLFLPWFALLYRFRPPQALVLHTTLAGMAALEVVLFGGDFGLVIAAVVINLLILGAGSLATYRFRKDFLGHWRSVAERGREQARMQEELETARTVQLSMLPNRAPQVSWLDIATATLPATEVGGDYYDFFHRPDDGLVVVIGDVAGHGLPSGLVLSGVRSGLHLLMDGREDLAESLERLNRMVRRTSHSRMLVSLLAVEFRSGGREIQVASAGHPPLLIRRQATGEVVELDLPALPLGSNLGGPAHAEARAIEPGDVLLLYTDGFFEATDPAGKPFGILRIREILAEHDPAAGSSALKERLLRELWSHRDHASQADDITLLALTVMQS